MRVAGRTGAATRAFGSLYPAALGRLRRYRAAAEATIAEVNASIERPLAPDVVEDRAPFELVPERGRCPRGADGRHARAALLLHDLGGTPYEMRDIARAFAADCYLVRAVLLPGHGTVPGDLLEIDYLRVGRGDPGRGREL